MRGGRPDDLIREMVSLVLAMALLVCSPGVGGINAHVPREISSAEGSSRVKRDGKDAEEALMLFRQLRRQRPGSNRIDSSGQDLGSISSNTIYLNPAGSTLPLLN